MNHKRKLSLPVMILWIMAAVFFAGGISSVTAQPVQAAAKNRFVKRHGACYYYNSRGKKVRGLQTINGKTYYFDSRGRRQTGMQRVRGKVRYFDPSQGYMVRNKVVSYKGKRYYMDKNGCRKTGRIKIGHNWYAFDKKTGAQLRGAWYTEKNGLKFYATKRYSLAKGLCKIGSSYYYFSPKTHRMLTGWQKIGRYQYLFHTRTGVMYANQKVILGKHMYCFGKQGRMYANRWVNLNGKTYYAGKNGILAAGWLKLEGNTYFLNSKGERLTGWITVNKKKYYMNPSTGIMNTDCWVDSQHYVGSDGAWIPNYKETGFAWPLEAKNNIVTSKFGPRKQPGPLASKVHMGIDIAARQGDPIYAVADGTIILIKANNGGAGNHIQIAHENDIVSEYMHQSKFAKGLKTGSRVKKGQIIGYVGNTGISYGAHLHLGIFAKGSYKDPLNYVKVPKK